MHSLHIALISEHASPLALLGGVDSGGQNVYVAQVARHLARLGHRVDVFTRRDDEHAPEIVEWEPGARVIHVPAGPATVVPKELLLDYMPAFTDWMSAWLCSAHPTYDLVHANFWMSALVAAELKASLGLPFAVTFHALGKVRRQHQGANDGFPDARFAIEERAVREADVLIAEAPQDEADLVALYDADPARIRLVPCGFDPDEFAPQDKIAARQKLGLPVDERIVLQLGRMVPRKGVENVVRGVAQAATRTRPRRAAGRRRRRKRSARSGDHAGNRSAAENCVRGQHRRPRHLCRAAWAAGAGRLLCRRGCFCEHALVRALWHHAAGGHGLRPARRRQQRGWPPVHHRRWRNGLPCPAQERRCAGRFFGPAFPRAGTARTLWPASSRPRPPALHLGESCRFVGRRFRGNRGQSAPGLAARGSTRPAPRPTPLVERQRMIQPVFPLAAHRNGAQTNGQMSGHLNGGYRNLYPNHHASNTHASPSTRLRASKSSPIKYSRIK